MSGRGKGRGKGRSQGRGGRGGGSGRGRTTNTNSTSSASKTGGLTAAIKQYTIEYGIKNCADHNRLSWEKIATYCGSLLGPDIATELTTGQEIDIPKPEYSQGDKA